MKHAGKRDLPHTNRPHAKRGRDAGAECVSRLKSTLHVEGDRAPRRPAMCIILEDLGEIPPGVFGMYPAALIAKLLPWLRCERREVLHVCSGGLPPGEGIRVDIRPEAKPDIVADGRALPLESGSVAAVLIDPPYSEQYARDLYGTDYPRPAHLLNEAARVVRPNGRIGIVHYITPNPPPDCTFIKSFGLSMGFGYPMRAVTFYERNQAELRASEPNRPAKEDGTE